MRKPLTVLLALCLAASAGRAGEIPPDAKAQDIRSILAVAKARVFPAVVFLMPIAERYEGGRKEKQQVAGSGVLISAKGEVVTNWHVVDKSVEIRCLLFDGSVGKAAVVGVDKDTDLALLRLEVAGRTEFPFAELGDSSKLSEGEFVMAMGAPWGLSRSLSLGIVSCTTRFLPAAATAGSYNLWIQTDASINPGNSGGPLVDTEGRVVGINTLGSMFGGDLAFAVPSTVVKSTVAALREHGRVPRAWVGLRLQPLKDFERNIFYPGSEGVLLASVDPESPAAAAGLQIGDLLLSLAGRRLSGVNREEIPAIQQAIAELPIDRAVAVEVLRDGKPLTLSLTPRGKGRVEGEDFECRDWNMTLKTINEFATPQLFFFRPKGVFVQGVKRPGNAAEAGIREGDILLAVEGKEIETLEGLQAVYEAALADPARGRKVVLTLLRSGLPRKVVLDYATRYETD